MNGEKYNGFSSRITHYASWFCAHVAQSAEHILGKDEVTGSIPVMGLEKTVNGNIVLKIKKYSQAEIKEGIWPRQSLRG